MIKNGIAISINIRKIRKSKNLTQQELADRLNIDQSTLSRYECEKHIPDIITLWDIADELDASLNELVTGEYNKND